MKLRLVLFGIFICLAWTSKAQVNPLSVFERDTVSNEFQAVRIKEVKLLYVPRGARLTSPITLLNKTIPLLKKY